MTEREIAFAAEDAAQFSGVMIVIYMAASACQLCSAARTPFVNSVEPDKLTMR